MQPPSESQPFMSPPVAYPSLLLKPRRSPRVCLKAQTTSDFSCLWVTGTTCDPTPHFSYCGLLCFCVILFNEMEVTVDQEPCPAYLCGSLSAFSLKSSVTIEQKSFYNFSLHFTCVISSLAIQWNKTILSRIFTVFKISWSIMGTSSHSYKRSKLK